MKLSVISILFGFCSVCLLGAIIAPVDFPSRTPRLTDSLEGAALYRDHCAACHGKDAQGDGYLAHAQRIQPADLTLLALHNGGVFPLRHVQQILAGDAEISAHGTREMPVWGVVFFASVQDDPGAASGEAPGIIRALSLAKYLEKIQSRTLRTR